MLVNSTLCPVVNSKSIFARISFQIESKSVMGSLGIVKMVPAGLNPRNGMTLPNRNVRLRSVFVSNTSSSSNSSSSSWESGDRERELKERVSLSTYLTRSQTYALLKQQLSVAAKFEDYKEAARLRDSLRSFEDKDPVLRLRKLTREAIDDERFDDAAKYRDELLEIAPHALLKCSSDATTLGIRVQVRSVYIEGRSRPMEGQFFYAYRIRITNNSERPVQLLRRHWIVTDGAGRVENIWGMGVIGQQPVILPKTGFEYSSACPLTTPNGRMEGDFEMKHVDKVGSATFNVAVAPFALSIHGDDSYGFLY